MNEPYCKLACSILDSSLWDESDAVRIVWVTLLAMKGVDGVVRASVSGIAKRARKTPEETQAALDKFMAPDLDSKNQDFEGRRVERVSGGWQVLNHDFYRNMFTADEHREYERERKAKYRASVKIVPNVPDSPGQSAIVPNVPNVPQCPAIRSDQIRSEETPLPLRTSPQKKAFVVPSRAEIDLLATKAGLPAIEAEKFWNHYMANGWKVGKNRMQSVSHAMGGWAARWRQDGHLKINGNRGTNQQTAAEKTADRYIREAEAMMKHLRENPI